MSTHSLVLPRLPVLSWAYLLERRKSPLPSIMEAKYRLPTTSGRAAIALALRATGCQAGDRILVPTYHCPTMVAPIVALGGKPVFYPTGPHGEALLDQLPAELLDGARAAIVPHYFGLPQPLSRIRALCDAQGIALIEDCAHAFFGLCEGQPVGSWGDYAIASLTKFFPVTEGGCLVSHRHPLTSPALSLARRPSSASLRVLADALELSVQHGRLAGLNSLLNPLFDAKRRLNRAVSTHTPSIPEDPLAAAILRAHADFSPEALPFSRIAAAARMLVRAGGSARTVRLRQTNYAGLAERLAGLRGARPLQRSCGGNAAPYVFPLWVDSPDEVYQKLRQSGVPVFRWDERWPATPDLPGDSGKKWSHHVFQIGCHQDLSATNLDWIAETLKTLIDGTV
ncbi:DegT/DnrJ/EryC1/StrS family aminotransferase [Niveibacterium terrae]|uniref:DegT/DnrJ/EryC1/StrS family aminotransferase n=1 Tax=Niveibacterium terrae TaxID=3373598 RepID=UPI003A948B61